MADLCQIFRLYCFLSKLFAAVCFVRLPCYQIFTVFLHVSPCYMQMHCVSRKAGTALVLDVNIYSLRHINYYYLHSGA